MRAVLVLMTLNGVTWGTLLVISGSHFSSPGSYKFWWFDDAPWAVLLVSVAAPALLALARVRLVNWIKWGLAALTGTTLIAFPLYAGMSGGGV